MQDATAHTDVLTARGGFSRLCQHVQTVPVALQDKLGADSSLSCAVFTPVQAHGHLRGHRTLNQGKGEESGPAGAACWWTAFLQPFKDTEEVTQMSWN